MMVMLVQVEMSIIQIVIVSVFIKIPIMMAFVTTLAQDKPRFEIDGQTLLLEKPLRADFALIHAAHADFLGNLTYAAAAQNFNPLMAMAAQHDIAEAEILTEPGGLSPEAIHTPAPFVDRLVNLPELTEDYGVIRR